MVQIPGPNSSPNGDKSLTDNTLVECKSCGSRHSLFLVRKREHLAKHNKLRTGKTGK